MLCSFGTQKILTGPPRRFTSVLLITAGLAAGCAGVKAVTPPPHQIATLAATCEVLTGIGQEDPTRWTGPCTRQIEQPHAKHVSIAGLNNGEIIPGILSISVSILGPGRADVRGLTNEGIHSRWGSAVQDLKDPFCWIGTDFRVCARPAP